MVYVFRLSNGSEYIMTKIFPFFSYLIDLFHTPLGERAAKYEKQGNYWHIEQSKHT